MSQLQEALCGFFEVDGKNCSSVVTMTPWGPCCYAHQKEIWRLANR